MREYITSKDPDAWVWPSDWPNIEECPDNEILILVKDHIRWGFICKVGTGTGTFSVDWGDGIIEHNLVGNGTTQFEHGSTTGGTLSNDGYLIWKARIFNASENITIWKVRVPSSMNVYSPMSIIAVNLGAAYIEDLSNCFDPNETIDFNDATPSVTWGGAGVNGFGNSDLKYLKIKSFQNCLSTKLMASGCNRLSKVVLPSSWGSVLCVDAMLSSCYALKGRNINLPSSWGSVLTARYFMNYCVSLTDDLQIPSSWGNLTSVYGFLRFCLNLRKINLPKSWGNIQCIVSFLQDAFNLTKLVIPNSWGNVLYANRAFNFMQNLDILQLPSSWGNLIDVSLMLQQTPSVKDITLPAQFGNITKAGSLINAIGIRSISGVEYLGSLTQQCDFATFCSDYNFPMVINSLVSKFSIDTGPIVRSNLSSLRLLNQGSLFAGGSPQIMVSYSAMGKSSLEILFGDIPNGLVSKTIAITGATGCDTLVSKTTSGTTLGSTTVTLSGTNTGLASGMEVYGTGLSLARAVTFTDAGDLVNRAAHGLANGMKISFSSITSTTGIAVNTPYYVVNKTNDTFQVSLTLGGVAIALVTNGSGNLIAIPTIVTVNSNNIVIDVPASATGSVTMTAGVLLRSIAMLKGWSVTN